MKTVFIYGHRLPEDSEIRYVGKSNDPERRLREHLTQASRGAKNHHATWIRSVLRGGKKPIVEIIDEVPEEHWRQLEVAYIEFFLEQGVRLTNGTLGGEGCNVPTEETRARLSQALKGENNPFFGKKHSANSLEKMRVASTGVHSSKETRKKMSLARQGPRNHQFGKPLSEAHKEKLRAAHTGKRLSDDTKAKIGAAVSGEKHPMFGKKHSEEALKKMRQPRSLEVRLRMQVGQLRRFAKKKQEKVCPKV